MTHRLLPVAALAALAVTYFTLTEGPTPLAADAPATQRAATTSPRAVPEALGAAAPITRPLAYRLEYRAEWVVDGGTPTVVAIGGQWTEQPSGGDRHVALTGVTITEHDALPTAAELTAPFALRVRGAQLLGLRVQPKASEATRRTLASLANAFWASPDAGTTWVRTEEDMSGRFEAHYTRADNTVTKTITRYLALRGPEGLSPKGADVLEPGGETRFTYDAIGLLRAEVDTTLTSDMNGVSPVTARIRASLVRVDDDPAPLAAAQLTPMNFDALLDFQGQAEQRDAELLDGADAHTLLAELAQATHIDRVTAEGRAARSLLLKRFSALARLEPAALPTLTAAIKAQAAEGASTSLLMGALASARTAAATDALADLSTELEGDAHHRSLNALNLAHTATEHSMEVLGAALEDDAGDAAALALGSQARKLADDAPEASTSAVTRLLEGLAAAQSPAEQATYIKALGNAGDRQALPALVALIEGNATLRGLALRALRFMPGDDVDALLMPHVQPASPAFQDALYAVAFRDPTRWAEHLRTLREALSAMETPPAEAVGSIDQVLARWSA